MLFIITLTLTFEGLLFGQDLIASSYPEMRDIDFGACAEATGSGPDGIWVVACYIGNFFLIIANFFRFLYGTGALLLGLISFNIPGAPGWVRALMGSLIGGPVLWAIATSLFRGSKA